MQRGAVISPSNLPCAVFSASIASDSSSFDADSMNLSISIAWLPVEHAKIKMPPGGLLLRAKEVKSDHE